VLGLDPSAQAPEKERPDLFGQGIRVKVKRVQWFIAPVLGGAPFKVKPAVMAKNRGERVFFTANGTIFHPFGNLVAAADAEFGAGYDVGSAVRTKVHGLITLKFSKQSGTKIKLIVLFFAIQETFFVQSLSAA
jgi:hypothetical protein